MTSQGVEALKAAFRRSVPLIVGLVVLGVIAVNAFQQLRGPSYEANARVLISTTPLTSIITGTQPSFVDPSRIQETAVGIAAAPEVYERAAEESRARFGRPAQLRSATEVRADPDSDLITFTSTASTRLTAIGRTNAVTAAYIDFRNELARAQVTDTIEGLESQLSELPEGSSERNTLEARVNRLRALRANVSDTQLIQLADSADQTSPAPLRDSLLGFFIGLVVALLVVALREAVDTTVRSEAEAEELISAPVLASVRRLPRRKRLVTYGRHEPAFADAYALLAAQLPRRPVRGAIPGRTAGDPPRGSGHGGTLAVTSALPREGKTTTAANLAVALARRGEDVLLADFDFRKPALSDLFGIPRDAIGTLQLLSRKATLDEALWSVSLHGPAPRILSENGSSPDSAPAAVADPSTGGSERVEEPSSGSLRILPTGGSTRSLPPPSQLGKLVRELAGEADFVILDTPPALLTVEVSELSQLIDRVLLVVRQGRVSQRNLRMLRRQTRSWSAELVGAVLTDVRPEGKYTYYGGR